MRIGINALSGGCAVLLLVGCAGGPHWLRDVGGPGASPDRAAPPAARPEVPPPPPAAAETAEQFDTTSPAERRAAARDTAGDWRALGQTVASLGDPAEPGFWARTPLVDEVQAGRLVDPATGATVQVELRPLAAERGAGTQVSLAALRLLGAPLTALTELTVEVR